nr:solute carrier family 35 member C2 [Hymenolepis microstoma]
MFTYESTQFDLRGFVLVLVASALSGVRWTAAQKVSQQSAHGLSNPIDLVYNTQPWMATVLLPLAFVFEGDAFLTSPFLFRSQDYLSILRITGYFVLGSCLAFGLEISEFLVVCHSSSLTLSIAGIFKEVVTLYLAATLNGDVYSPLNIAGLFICLAGICLRVAVKFLHADRRERRIQT